MTLLGALVTTSTNSYNWYDRTLRKVFSIWKVVLQDRVRVQAKRRPPSRQHIHESSNASQLLAQPASSIVNDDRLPGSDDVSGGGDISLPTPTPVIRGDVSRDGDISLPTPTPVIRGDVSHGGDISLPTPTPVIRGDVSHGGDISLPTPTPVIRAAHPAVGDTPDHSSVTDGSHNKKSSAAVGHPEGLNATQSYSSVTTSADIAVSSGTPGDSLSAFSKTQMSKPSSDVDDIFANSSLFATCKCLYNVCMYIYCIYFDLIHKSYMYWLLHRTKKYTDVLIVLFAELLKLRENLVLMG